MKMLRKMLGPLFGLLCCHAHASAVFSDPAEIRSCVRSDGGERVVDSALQCEDRFFDDTDDVDALIDLAILRLQESLEAVAGNLGPSEELFFLADDSNALMLIDMALDQDPKNSRAYVVQSDIFEAFGESERALDALKKAERAGASGIDLRYAQLQYQLGDFQSVAADYGVVSSNPEPVETGLLQFTAASLYEIGDIERAGTIYGEIAQRSDPGALTYLFFAETAAQSGEADAALENYYLALEYPGAGQLAQGVATGTRGYPHLAAVLYDLPPSIEEADALCRALDGSPGSARIAMRLAQVLEDAALTNRSRHDQRILALRAVVNTATWEDADILMAAGEALEDLGLNAVAAKAYVDAYYYASEGFNRRSIPMEEIGQKAAELLVSIGVDRALAMKYVFEPEAIFGLVDETFPESDYDPTFAYDYTFAQVSITGPHFSQALTKFYDYWLDVDFPSLEVEATDANPCVDADQRFESVIIDNLVLLGRYDEDYRQRVHPQLRQKYSQYQHEQLHDALQKVSDDEGHSGNHEMAGWAVEDLLLSRDAIDTIPLRGVYAIPRLNKELNNSRYEVPKEQFPDGPSLEYCRSVWLTGSLKSCEARESKDSYVIPAHAITLDLRIPSDRAEETYSSLLEWMEGADSAGRYEFSAYLGGATPRDWRTDGPHHLSPEGNEKLIEFAHNNNATIGCPDFDIKDDFNDASLEFHVSSYYQAINFELNSAGLGSKKDVIYVIDYFPTGKDLKDLHFEFKMDDASSKIACIREPRPDQDIHGVKVAGVIGAKQNKVGLVGIAPTSRISAKGPPGGHLTPDNVIDMIADIDSVAAKRTMGVVNMSFEFTGQVDVSDSQSLVEEIDEWRDDILFVFPTGTGKPKPFNTINPGCDAWPACAGKLPNAIAVAPLKIQPWTSPDIWDDSDYGPYVSIAAPARSIVTTIPEHDAKFEGYSIEHGASFASAFVSGTASVLIRKHPDLEAYQLKQRLIATSDFLDLSDVDGNPRSIRGGRLNYSRAVNNVMNDVVILSDGAEKVGEIVGASNTSKLVFARDRVLEPEEVLGCEIEDLLRIQRISDSDFNVVCLANYTSADGSIDKIDVAIERNRLFQRMNGGTQCSDEDGDGVEQCFTIWKNSCLKDDGAGHCLELVVDGVIEPIKLSEIDNIYFGFEP